MTSPPPDRTNPDEGIAFIQSFVIKIWFEERVPGQGAFSYRGYITHVPSGSRRYFNAIEEIIPFINRYFEELGARPYRAGLLRGLWDCLTKRTRGR